MVTRNTVAKLEQRIEAAISRLNPEPPKPQHPGLARLREILARYSGAEQAEASIAEAAREGHENLREHPAHPLYGRTDVTEEEERAVRDAANAKFKEKMRRWQ
jgi:hypothetical protein